MAAAAPPSDEECPVCHDDFTDPKILPCTHLVCRKCVFSWLHKGGNQAGCPLCRASLLPQGSSGQDVAALVDDLPTDIITKAAVESRRVLNEKHVCVCDGTTKATSFCMQCSIKFCPSCVKVHKVIPATGEHDIKQIASLTVDKLAASYQSSCAVHPGRQVEQFCSSHQELICINCSTSTHRRCPDVEGIAEAAMVKRQRLKEQEKKLEGKKDEIQTQVCQLDIAAADGLAKFKAMKDKVKRTFEELRGILDKRCRDATAEIQKKEDEFLKENKSQKNDLEKLRARSAALCSTVSRLASASDDPLLAMLVKVKSRLEDAELLCRHNDVFRQEVSAAGIGHFFFDLQSLAYLQELIAGCGQFEDHKKQPERVSMYKSNDTSLARVYARANVNESTIATMPGELIPNLEALEIYRHRTSIVTSKTETNPAITVFNPKQKDEMFKLQKKHNVEISLDNKKGAVTFTGIDIDVTSAVSDLKDIILSATTQRHLAAGGPPVRWQYQTGKDKFADFDPETNLTIEAAFKKKESSVHFSDKRSRRYKIVFKDKKEYSVDDRSAQPVAVKRRDIMEEKKRDIPLPDHWEPMKGDKVKLVKLKPESSEYKRVAGHFGRQGQASVKKIERVQNPSLFQQYKIKKREIEQNNPKGTENEKRLFHGTSSNSIQGIVTNGFNRSYCGKNGTALGNGVYFAADSATSMGYAQGGQMFQARVLVGEYTPGNSGMRMAPNKPGSNRPYDCVSNGQPPNATVFVIFHDCQAYPEYLISF